MYFPALNEIERQTLGEKPTYPENADEKYYMILYPEDYQSYGSDMKGNLALLLDEENAREIKRLAENIIEELE
jgi:hypothetical protein